MSKIKLNLVQGATDVRRLSGQAARFLEESEDDTLDISFQAIPQKRNKIKKNKDTRIRKIKTDASIHALPELSGLGKVSR